jgi:hypothetical protein
MPFMNSAHRPPSDSAEPQELFDAETLQSFERCERMISSGSPKEKRQERRAAWRATPTAEKLWIIGQFITFILAVAGIIHICRLFDLPGIFVTILWCVVGLTASYSVFRKP